MPIPKTFRPVNPLAKAQQEREEEASYKSVEVEQRLIDLVFVGGLVKGLTLEPGDILNDSDLSVLSIRFVDDLGNSSEILVNMDNVLFVEKSTRTVTKKIPIDPLSELRRAETTGSVQ